MKIIWEEIYDNNHIKNTSFYEATYRAKVIGGWLIRHETCFDYQFDNVASEIEPNSLVRYIHDEGYQKFHNAITFVPDQNHEWGKDIMDGVI